MAHVEHSLRYIERVEDHLNELDRHYGYWIVLLFMISIALGLILYFYRKDWAAPAKCRKGVEWWVFQGKVKLYLCYNN